MRRNPFVNQVFGVPAVMQKDVHYGIIPGRNPFVNQVFGVRSGTTTDDKNNP